MEDQKRNLIFGSLHFKHKIFLVFQIKYDIKKVQSRVICGIMPWCSGYLWKHTARGTYYSLVCSMDVWMVHRSHSHMQYRLPDFASTEGNSEPFVDFCGPWGGAAGIWLTLVLYGVMMRSSGLAGLFSSPVQLSSQEHSKAFLDQCSFYRKWDLEGKKRKKEKKKEKEKGKE